jgi:hypothetical protein
MYLCEECNLVFEKPQQKANHIRWTHEQFDRIAYTNKLKQSLKISIENKLGKFIEEIVKCDRHNGCSNLINIKYRNGKKKDKYFCSRTCANSHIWNESQKELHLKRFYDQYDSYGKSFQDNIGKIQSIKYFSSKNERSIVEFFKTKFPDDCWKSGGGTKINGIQICRDLWSDKLKVCFEYDGVWHFKDIHGQLEHKKFKDKLLEVWCIENNYRLVRIDENAYINVHQIVDLIYNKSDQIIKIGNRY